MISIRQMRAARALLDWKQSDLAKVSGLSLTALNNIEREAASPRFSTMDLIRQSFERHGVAFTEDDGVKMHAETFSIRTLEGRDSVKLLFDDVIDTLRKKGGEVVWGGTDESWFVKNRRNETFEYYDAMARHGLKERALCMEGTKKLYAPRATTQYHALPKSAFSATNYGVYGNKYCLSLFGKKERTVIIEHESVAETHRQQFEICWKMGKYITCEKSIYEEDREKVRRGVKLE